MAKKTPSIEPTEEGGVTIDLSPRDRREFKGSDADPTDAETGDSVFDELSPRFNLKLDEAAAKERKRAAAPAEDEDEDEGSAVESDEDENETPIVDEDEETPAEDEVDDTDEVDSDDEDRPARKQGKFEKRLARADRLVEETRAESAALRARLDAAEARQQELADEGKYKAAKDELESALTEARVSYRKAVEEGDTAAQDAANEKLIDIKGDLKVLDIRHGDAKLSKVTSAAETSSSTITKTKSQQWIRKHGKFNTDVEFAETARTVDKQVAAAGFNPETDAYYKELDRRMARFYPKEFAKGGRVTETVPVRRKHPASGMAREDGGVARKATTTGPFAVKNGRAVLTARHIKTMRDFNMDPTNPNDVRDFVEQNR